MDLTEELCSRKSIRKFLSRKVPQEIIKEILCKAHSAPSSSNQQPWNFLVIIGKPLENLRARILQAHDKNFKAYDPSKGKTIPGAYVERTRTLFKELRPFLKKLGEENRSFIETGSLGFYNAPVAIFITIHNSLPRNRLMDIGMAAQNLMLAAHARGLGACAIGLILLYEEILRAEIPVPPEFDIALSIALGYPDTASPINEFRSSREQLDNFITWIGFQKEDT